MTFSILYDFQFSNIISLIDQIKQTRGGIIMIRYCMNYVSLKLKEEKGQGMVEYALLVALIAVVVIAGLVILGPIIKQKFIDISTELT